MPCLLRVENLLDEPGNGDVGTLTLRWSRRVQIDLTEIQIVIIAPKSMVFKHQTSSRKHLTTIEVMKQNRGLQGP